MFKGKSIVFLFNTDTINRNGKLWLPAEFDSTSRLSIFDKTADIIALIKLA